jgi:hypothetical protein
MALIGFSGQPMPAACYEDDLLASAWRAGRTQAIDKGIIKPAPIKIAHSSKA